jgi:hypothetical protein
MILLTFCLSLPLSFISNLDYKHVNFHMGNLTSYNLSLENFIAQHSSCVEIVPNIKLELNVLEIIFEQKIPVCV